MSKPFSLETKNNKNFKYICEQKKKIKTTTAFTYLRNTKDFQDLLQLLDRILNVLKLQNIIDGRKVLGSKNFSIFTKIKNEQQNV